MSIRVCEEASMTLPLGEYEEEAQLFGLKAYNVRRTKRPTTVPRGLRKVAHLRIIPREQNRGSEESKREHSV